MKILILCTGNSCRSQMAEGILRNLDENIQVYSAGTMPANEVNPLAIKVMDEIGIDISWHKPKLVNDYINMDFDYVITVCDTAQETCPIFVGKVKHKIHIGFDDPAKARGTIEEQMEVYRRVRNEIRSAFTNLYQNINEEF